MREAELVRRLLVALSLLPGVRVWRQNAGKVRTVQGHWYQGLPDGAADIGGIGPGGIMLQIECKTSSGTMRQAQLAWRQMIDRHGGVYYVAKPARDETPEVAVDRIVRQIRIAIEMAQPLPVAP